jgi:glycosyltransferase involved in cell wall biosynthesis
MTSSPKLSICIPTYNRSKLLRDLLASLVIEVVDLEVDVEIVISDNCSDDETSAIVDGYRERLNLVYHRNNENKGAAANVLSVTDHASGLYCWIFGDDDLPVPGSIKRVVNIIDNNPEILGIVTGYSYERADEKSEFIKPNLERGFRSPVFKGKTQEGMVSRWEDTILLSDYSALHTSIVGCVFRLSIWRSVKAEILSDVGTGSLTSVENTFPQTVVWANMFIGKPIYLLSAPQVYFFVGDQEWFKPKWSAIQFSFCLQLAQYFRKLGAIEEPVRYYESTILKSRETLLSLFTEWNDYSNKYFSCKWLIGQYGNRMELWESLSWIMSKLGVKHAILFGIKTNFYALANLQFGHHLFRFDMRLAKKICRRVFG